MDGVLKSDIFFFISSAAVILVSIGIAVAVIYLIKILRDVKDITRTVKRESHEVAKDLSDLRTKARNGSMLAGAYGFIRSFFKRRKSRK